MNLEFKSLSDNTNLIAGVVLHPLKINRDSRGLLVENLKSNWEDVYKTPGLVFGQNYCSVTLPGYARDEKMWHNHPTKQTDRFVVMKGNAVFALYDWRRESPTNGLLNLFLMGEKNSDNNQFLLLIPTNVLHAFAPVGKEPVYLLGFPDRLYDPDEEGRIPHDQVSVTFPDGSAFSWEKVRDYFATSE